MQSSVVRGVSAEGRERRRDTRRCGYTVRV